MKGKFVIRNRLGIDLAPHNIKSNSVQTETDQKVEWRDPNPMKFSKVLEYWTQNNVQFHVKTFILGD